MKNKITSSIAAHLPHSFREIATHFSYLVTFRILNQIITLISFFFIIKYIPQEMVGHYHFVLSIIGLVSITSLPGLRQSLVQAIARKSGGFFKVALKYSLIGSTIGSLILFGFALYYYLNSNITMCLSFILAGLFNPATKGLFIWKNSLSGDERFKLLSVLESTNNLILSLCLMASVLFYNESYILLLLLALAIPSMQNFTMALIEYKKYKDETNKEEDLLEYGLKSSLYNSLSLISQEVDKLSIYNFVNASELAIYNVAAKIPAIFKLFISNIGNVITPKLAKIPYYTKSLNKYFTLFSAFLLIFILLISFTILDDIFYMFIPEEYHSGLPYAQALLLTFSIGNFGYLKARYIFAHKNIESNKKITIMSNLIKIILTPFLVLFFQTWGAIISIFIQRLFISIYVTLIIKKYHTQKIQDV